MEDPIEKFEKLMHAFNDVMVDPMVDMENSIMSAITNDSSTLTIEEAKEEEEIRKIEEEIIMDLMQFENEYENGNRKKRIRKSFRMDFWETMQGQTLSNPRVKNPKSAEGKKFRRRFRVPYPLFVYLTSVCKEFNVFDTVYTSTIPFEAKVLGCLRILGRDFCADSVTEITADVIGESTMNYIFKKFIHGMTKKVFPFIVKPATGDYLKQVLADYAALGLHGAVGSMDCTHVKWVLCPNKKRFRAIGKEGFPTLAFQVVVDHNRRVQSVSQSFMGATPDKTICVNHLFSLAAQNGSLEHIEYELYNSFGDKYKCRGGYIIVDGGYNNCICFIDLDKYRIDRQAVIWSEWVESVRKDVECLFGAIKIRFHFIRNGIGYHNRDDIEAAFKTVCCLHNMILLFDGLAGSQYKLWEDVDWENLDPDGDDIEDDVDFIADENNDDDVSLPDLIPETLNSNEQPLRPRIVDDVTVFKVTDPKSLLKSALQVSLNIQWIKHKLMWPKSMTEVMK